MQWRTYWGVGGIIFGQSTTPELIYKFALCLSICELRTWIPHSDICKGHPCAFWHMSGLTPLSHHGIKGQRPPPPSMSAIACVVLALELLWFSGASLQGWWIPSTDINTGREVMRRRSSWNRSVPNMAGVKDYLRARSSGSKVLYGWYVTLWEYY